MKIIVVICQCFFEYFEKIFIGVIDEHGKFKEYARYQIDFWNVYLRIKSNVARKINSVEAWHRTSNFRNQVAHLNIIQLINEFSNEKNKKTNLKYQG
jgi:hypothetical protein